MADGGLIRLRGLTSRILCFVHGVMVRKNVSGDSS